MPFFFWCKEHSNNLKNLFSKIAISALERFFMEPRKAIFVFKSAYVQYIVTRLGLNEGEPADD